MYWCVYVLMCVRVWNTRVLLVIFTESTTLSFCVLMFAYVMMCVCVLNKRVLLVIFTESATLSFYCVCDCNQKIWMLGKQDPGNNESGWSPEDTPWKTLVWHLQQFVGNHTSWGSQPQGVPYEELKCPCYQSLRIILVLSSTTRWRPGNQTTFYIEKMLLFKIFL